MKFKDIVNQDLVNLANCEQEPIHIPGSIQPHGVLIGVKRADFTIDFCSGNSFELAGVRHEQLLGKNFELILGAVQTNNLKKYISTLDPSTAAPVQLKLGSNDFTCTVQTGTDIYILECEPSLNEIIASADIYQQTKQFTTYMQKASTLKALCQLVAEETRALTGYDRVMIYRFDEEYNGEIFAESRTETIEPFLNLHYPHTDIPVQARELYKKNLFRIIADVNYTPVPIYTIDDALGKTLDLSLSTLRSVSPIHIQYLHNMGVGATLTISLLHQNRLWGLIACHHYSPKYITYDTRIAAQLQGHFLTSQISVRQLAEEYEVAKKVNAALDELMAQVFSAEGMTLEKIIQKKALLSLTNAASVIIVLEEKIYSQGLVPEEEEIKKLVSWLHAYNSPVGFNTTNLSLLYPDSKKWCAIASGIIFHSLGGGLNNCIIWCRPDALQEVHWAGNPEKAVIKDEKGLSPRKSFELWKEVKKGESTKWQKPELVAAVSFASALQKHVHVLFLTREELKQRKLNERLKEANAELENLNWIGTHDLKEPLRKIQLFASKILDEEQERNYEMIFSSVKRMSESAKRMQVLISDILSYSRSGHTEESLKVITLTDLVKGVVEELSFEINEKKATIHYSALPDVKGIPFLLDQLMVNLIRNALKFSKPAVPPYITITAIVETAQSPAEPQLVVEFDKIMVQDNGIGFESQFKESIFKVFTRLHNYSEYGGSGIGLALCRKIMKSHGGYITAESTPGVGTVFSIYFPKQ